MFWWENRFLKAREGNLYLGDREAREYAEEHGTPLFIYSKQQIISNFHTILKFFRENTGLQTRIYYAMKANSNSKILEHLRHKGAWIDATSPAEVDRACALGFPGKKTLFTGTSLSIADFQQVLRHKDVIVTIDAEEQLELMKKARENYSKNKTIKVSIRWNPGIGRGFSPKAITAGKKSVNGTPVKFGIEEKRILLAFAKAVEYGFVPVALHQHLGSGWVKEDFEAVKIAVDKMINMASKLNKGGFNLEFLDFGGGFGPQYSEDHEVFPLEDYIKYICQKIARADLNLQAIALEPGKHLVGDAGVLLLRVEYMKKSYGNLFACVSGGTFNTVPRLAIYPEARHHIINCNNIQSAKMAKITVAGNLCETGDVFGKDILMSLPQRGDILAVLCAGAYCRSMASNFNLREIPEEIVI